jgi:hypothetical protein
LKTTALYPLFTRPPRPRRDPERDAQLVRYVDLLLKLVQKHPTQELMDRIERVMPWLEGIPATPPPRPTLPPPPARRPPAGSRGTPRGRSGRRRCSGCGSAYHDIRYHRAEVGL